MIRKILPAGLKRRIRLMQRKSADRKAGYSDKFARSKSTVPKEFKAALHIHQPIFYNPLSANKVENIQIAIEKIHGVEIKPGQLFSFWELIGNPSEKNGFKSGRNIIGDSLQEDVGGGLCQVGGMIYHLALTAGMEIIERHCHSLDLYEENKRYTPLGADASVVYGYKDIRFKNNHPHSIFLNFRVNQESFEGEVLSAVSIDEHQIEFVRTEQAGFRTIDTFRYLEGQKKAFINNSKYLLPAD